MRGDEALYNIFESFLDNKKIFCNRDVLRHDYIPYNLPHRDEEIQRLGGILAPALENCKISNVFAYGKTGTGKTAVARFVLGRLQKKGAEVGASIQTCYVNCRLTGTNYRVLADLCRAVGFDVPFTGLAVGEVFKRFHSALNRKRLWFIVILDEIDALVRRQENNLLYELTRINEGLRESWVGLVGVSNDLHFKEYLDARVLSCLSEEEIVFKPYLADELYDILLDRAKIAFAIGALDNRSLRLCAALAAGEHGDARRALDLLRVAGELAERQGESCVSEDHVRLAQRKIEYDRVSEALKSLPSHSKVLLSGSYILERRFPEGSVTGDLYEVYSELCGIVGIEPLTQRRVSGLINELDVMGILNARVMSFGRYGRTKKIRLGVSSKTITEVLSDDEVAGALLGTVPKCLHRIKAS